MLLNRNSVLLCKTLHTPFLNYHATQEVLLLKKGKLKLNRHKKTAQRVEILSDRSRWKGLHPLRLAKLQLSRDASTS